jgi:AAA+ superfamily predicted ATPase
MSKDTVEKFICKNRTRIDRMEIGHELMTSDLCIQNDEYIYQFELVSEKNPSRKKYKIKPGIFNIVPTQAGLILDDMKLREPNLLESVVNTTTILNEAHFFFNRLNVYDELGLEKRRAILLHGVPGTGKTASITRICNKLVEEDPNTVIINWNSATIRSGDVLDFFSAASEFTAECSRLVLIIEDIGSDHESHYGPRSVDRSLLNLLDGAGVSFSVPTFILATTNYAANLPENLANRPGRFDKMIQINPPSPQERVDLTAFIAKRELTVEEKDVIMNKKFNKFSVAHLKEIVVRSKLDEKSIGEVANELHEHYTKFNKGFEDSGNLGLKAGF